MSSSATKWLIIVVLANHRRYHVTRQPYETREEAERHVRELREEIELGKGTDWIKFDEGYVRASAIEVVRVERFGP